MAWTDATASPRPSRLSPLPCRLSLSLFAFPSPSPLPLARCPTRLSPSSQCYTAPMTQRIDRVRARRLARAGSLQAAQGAQRNWRRRRHAGRLVVMQHASRLACRPVAGVRCRLARASAWRGTAHPALRGAPFEWGEFRTLFRQVSEVLRRYDLLEQADLGHVQELIRAGRPTRDDVSVWYEETASRTVAVRRPRRVRLKRSGRSSR